MRCGCDGLLSMMNYCVVMNLTGADNSIKRPQANTPSTRSRNRTVLRTNEIKKDKFGKGHMAETGGICAGISFSFSHAQICIVCRSLRNNCKA
jgi:hypothetical protein